jgi:hypothetical protein
MTLTHRSRLAGLVAAALAAAAGVVGLSSTAASAAVCSSTGITAVVDYNDGAGGGITTACTKASGSRKAVAVFGAAGVSMKRNPDGSVCQVNGKPADANCSRLGNQYWGLWWSNGKNGAWAYSQSGVDSLTIPENGSVAWAWQGPSGKRQPGVAPPVVKETPAPAPKPTRTPRPTKAPAAPKPTKKATVAAAAKATARATATATTKARVSAKATAKAPDASARARPSASASRSDGVEPSPSDQASPAVTSAQKANSAFTPKDEHSGLPTWVPVGVIVVLGGAAGGAVWWRRRTGAA